VDAVAKASRNLKSIGVPSEPIPTKVRVSYGGFPLETIQIGFGLKKQGELGWDGHLVLRIGSWIVDPSFVQFTRLNSYWDAYPRIPGWELPSMVEWPEGDWRTSGKLLIFGKTRYRVIATNDRSFIKVFGDVTASA